MTSNFAYRTVFLGRNRGANKKPKCEYLYHLKVRSAGEIPRLLLRMTPCFASLIAFARTFCTSNEYGSFRICFVYCRFSSADGFTYVSKNRRALGTFQTGRLAPVLKYSKYV